MEKKTTMLMILDGFGINEKEEGNAVKLANIPNINRILKQYPNTIIHTSGLDVGLPEGQMGNSEVGHTNIGAGRIVYQELTRITKSIEDGDFFSIPELVSAIEGASGDFSIVFYETSVPVEDITSVASAIKSKGINPNSTPNVSLDMSYEDMSKRIIESISNYFKLQLGRPEILNRIGENFVVFDFIREDFLCSFEGMIFTIP